MRIRDASIMLFLSLSLSLGLARGAAAQGEAAEVQAQGAPCRIELLEGATIQVTREIVVPAVTRRVCTPVYADILVPIEERRRTPRYEEIETPVYAWRLVPVYRSREAPLYGTRLEPVYLDVKRRVSLPICAPFTCACAKIPLYETCEKVQVAWLEKEAIEGYRTDSFARGMRRERYVARTETRRVLVGHDEQVVQVGTRTKRMLKGYETQVIELSPARTEIVLATVTLPARRVTVSTGGEPVAPLPGTAVVLTSAEYEALAARR